VIKSAAIKQNGKIYTGKRHHLIVGRIMDTHLHYNGEQGFITTDGQFLSREEAATYAFKVGQIKKKTKVLYSDDIY
jgi:hypothetical protein